MAMGYTIRSIAIGADAPFLSPFAVAQMVPMTKISNRYDTSTKTRKLMVCVEQNEACLLLAGTVVEIRKSLGLLWK